MDKHALTPAPLRVLVVATEASADVHAAAVVRELRAGGACDVRGIGGQASRAAGVETVVDSDRLGVMGIVDVLKALPRFVRAKRRVLAEVVAWSPHVALLVDGPDFNLRLLPALRHARVPVAYYIAPKVWASRPGRVRLLTRVERLAGILPFEPAWFSARGVDVDYVGNPSVEAVRMRLRGAPLSTVTPLRLALIPGSRRGEVSRHVPVFAALIQRVQHENPGAQFVVPQAPSVPGELLEPLRAAGATVVRGDVLDVVPGCTAAVVASGTASLECALAGVPQVVVYKVPALTAWIARRVMTAPHVSLVNLVLEQRAVPELLQEDFHVASVTDAVSPLLREGDARAAQLAAIDALRARFDAEQTPSAGVARIIRDVARRT